MNISTVEKQFGDELTRIQPMPLNSVDIDVLLSVDSPLLKEYVSELNEAIHTKLGYTGGHTDLNEETLLQYAATLVHSRVNYVLGRTVTVHPMDRIAVPAYISLLLSNIGDVKEVTTGIYLHPRIKEEGFVPLTKEEMKKISRKLEMLGAIGLEYSEGYLRDKTGSWDFMTMVVMENAVDVQRYNNQASPVYSVLAATLLVRGVESILVPRVSYGRLDDMKRLMSTVARLKG